MVVLNAVTAYHGGTERVMLKKYPSLPKPYLGLDYRHIDGLSPTECMDEDGRPTLRDHTKLRD